MTQSLPLLARIPMTAAALEALRREVDSLARELEGGARPGDGRPGDAVARSGTVPIPIDRGRSARTLSRLRGILEAATVEDRADVAVVGRRVTIHDTTDHAERGPTPIPMAFSLVLPGDGDPSLGWVSIESPLGAAIAGRRVGDRTLVAAPGGDWGAVVIAVE